jgi:hypothetical protein
MRVGFRLFVDGFGGRALHRSHLVPFGLNAEGCMRNDAKAVLRDQLASGPADAIRLILDPDQCIFEGFYKLFLAGSELAVLFF